MESQLQFRRLVGVRYQNGGGRESKRDRAWSHAACEGTEHYTSALTCRARLGPCKKKVQKGHRINLLYQVKDLEDKYYIKISKKNKRTIASACSQKTNGGKKVIESQIVFLTMFDYIDVAAYKYRGSN